MIVKGSGAPTARAGTSTAVLVLGAMLTYALLPSDSAVNIFASAAIGVGLSLAIATGVEGMSGVRNLARVDVLMLWVLYGLTVLEFLFPQSDVDAVVPPDAATDGTTAVLLGLAGLAVGRHLVPSRQNSQVAAFADVRPNSIFLLFVLAFLFGYLHIFIAVKLDIFEMLRQMSLPRFAQSWGRGRYGGDLYSLLVEVGALIYLVPPIAGLIYAHAKEFHAVQKLVVTIVLLLTIYYGFSSGTRNILAVYVFTFFGSYFLNQPGITLWKAGLQGSAAIVVLLIVTSYMLEFRNVGLAN